MYPWFRFIRAQVGAVIQPRVGLFDTTRVRLRIWPQDLDLNFHTNNGRYLTLADIGRLHWFVRTGISDAARRRRVYPVVGDAIARFRRDLKVFDAFDLDTRLLGWDERWGFIEHRFIRGGRVIGVVAVRGVFTGPQGVITPVSLLEVVGSGAQSPALPEWATRFHQASDQLSGLLREEERAQGLRT